MIQLQVNGKNYTDFLAADVQLSIDQLVGGFAFQATATPASIFPFSMRDVVKVIADGFTVITGVIDKIEVSYDAFAHTISITGRSLLADLVDSSIDEQINTTELSLAKICEKVLSDIGLNVKVIDNSGTSEFKDYDIASSEEGQTAFEFIQALANKRQVLLTSDSDGNLLLTRAGTETAPFNLQNKLEAKDNNILTGTYTTDQSSQFYKYKVNSQLSLLKMLEETTPEDAANQSGIAINESIRETRLLSLTAEENSDNETDVDRAKWERNIRKARGIGATYNIQGHSMGGKEIKINQLVQVNDDYLSLNEKMLIKMVNLKYSLDSGSITTIQLSDPKAYTLDD